jgi:hypothetical protein
LDITLLMMSTDTPWYCISTFWNELWIRFGFVQDLNAWRKVDIGSITWKTHIQGIRKKYVAFCCDHMWLYRSNIKGYRRKWMSMHIHLRLFKGNILLLMITYKCISSLEFLVSSKYCRITKFVLYGAEAVQHFEYGVYFLPFSRDFVFSHAFCVIFKHT